MSPSLPSHPLSELSHASLGEALLAGRWGKVLADAGALSGGADAVLAHSLSQTHTQVHANVRACVQLCLFV